LKLFIDNNLPPQWAAMILAAARGSPQLQLTRAVSLRDRFATDTADLTWIESLGEEGGWTVLSSDRFTKGKARPERHLLRRQKLNFFVLSKTWSSHQHLEKSARVLLWLPQIALVTNSSVGAGFEVPWNLNSKLVALR
jgi:hypothetical protein